MTCEIFGCQEKVYNRLSIGPGTSTALCEKHFTEFKKELMPEYPKQGGEDMVKLNTEKSGVLEVKLTGVDIPKAGILADLLQEWVTWVNTYNSLLKDVGGLNDLRERTTEAVQKWGRDG
jgi:hypothetical protein